MESLGGFTNIWSMQSLVLYSPHLNASVLQDLSSKDIGQSARCFLGIHLLKPHLGIKYE